MTESQRDAKQVGRDAGLDGSRTGWMQEGWRMTGGTYVLIICRTGGMHEGQEEGGSVGRQDRRDTGQDVIRK